MMSMHQAEQEAPHGVTRPGAAASRSRYRRRAVNLSRPERAGRIVIGIAGIALGTVLLVAAGSVLVIVLEVLLVLAGLDLVVTGAFGHCPLYQKLGHVPSSLSRQI